ncbi:cob(I)yrinic acid a,c-diamide adenosyltransferase [Youxingia wuxianensis]|uniref:Cob(I)yrinic acid a,c-diamide adenosyltransferase n=1 Tax=Youxingia wuxianensis TaxID=2763678 RepID=A0A926IGP4_9FIRM|nr:cob(I)yrinic acid a,c-diamide adenosyltransferase [Youxingia wuxianensis]MBC8585089.1 cob(I)yrinic acid a,c-diamide adenosyltransferase [Youxingia wuxianensis]
MNHIYCGDGKGKTTAAIGLAVRAAGRGKRVLILQFLKGQPTGELESLKKISNIRVIRGKLGGKFTFEMDRRELQQTYDIHTKNLLTVVESVRAGECDLVILDEVIGALNTQLIDEDLLRNFIQEKPADIELVMTGRNPPQWLLDMADYITEMKKIKHPFDLGVKAREGIEM